MRSARWALAAIFLCATVALARFVAVADQAWFVRHVLTLDYYDAPARSLPALVRGGAALAALLSLWAAVRCWQRPPSPGAIFRVGLAVLLAFLAGEFILRYAERHQSEERRMLHRRLGQPHPKFGWILTPSLATTVRLAGREIDLAFDARGNRVRSPQQAPDPAAPSLLVAGESVAIGHDLRWDETFAAKAAARLGLQAVNLAVNGYSVDQAYLRLIDALPDYSNARAVVMLVMPVQLGRNLIDNHPRLVLRDGGRLELLPEATGWLAELRLRGLLVQQLPYRSDADIERTLALTRALLSDVATKAKAKGAKVLFVLPGAVGWVTEALFAGSELQHVEVQLNEREKFANDGHPNAAGAEKLAAAIVAALELTKQRTP